MMNNSIVLLKTLLLSTSNRNIYRYTTDRRKKKRIVAGTIGMALVYILVMAYCIAMCIGYGTSGLIESAPVMCALIISLLAFVFTLFKTNGYLFNFREYDMLMSLPFEARTVAACKFLYMYVNSLPWYLSISVAMMIGYGVFQKPSIIVYPMWLITSLFLPVIPMLAASFFGFLIARVSAGFKKTNIVQTVLSFVFIIFCFSLRFILEYIFKNDKVDQILHTTSQVTGTGADIYRPARWFSDFITKEDYLGMLLLLGVSIVLFAVVFRIVGRSYRNINSALKSHAASKKYKMKGQKTKSVIHSIVFKEFKRMTGSTVYMTNVAIGEILSLLLAVVILIFGFNTIISVVTQGAPIDASMLQPAIPFICYFFIGMLATTVCSPSLEGKNYWIIKSLPVEMKTVYQGKMLFNMYLTVPFMLVSELLICISAKAPVVDTVLYLILGFVLCAFSTSWGCVCGVRHIRLDWENEVEVIKQGSGVAIYMLPNMFAAMALMVLSVFLGTLIGSITEAVIFILVAALLAFLSYRRVMSMVG